MGFCMAGDAINSSTSSWQSLIKTALAVAYGLAASWLAFAEPAEPLPALPAALQLGKKIYDQNCAGCHGHEGHGDGAAAPYLYPKPRDFSKGLFKLISSPMGSLPTDQDLFRVITEGMPGSAMPSWELLKVSDRWAVIAHVKSLVKAWDEEEERWIDLYQVRGKPQPIIIPTEPQVTPESIARGKLVFRQVECWTCHGDGGRGDGPSSATLKDSWNHPIRPRDFTAGIFKGGDQPSDLYRRITIGMPGSPMPAHEKVSESDRWDLIHYIRSIIRPGAQTLNAQRRKAIPVIHLAGDLPESPADKIWDPIDPIYLALMPLWWREHRVEGLLVRAVHNSKEIAFHVSWEDTHRNASAVRTEQFSDGLAIQFALSDDAPFIAMGGTGGKVNIWFWLAEREMRPDVDSEYPGMVADCYEFTSPGNGSPRKTEYFFEPRPAAQHAALFLPAWKTGNWLANPLRSTPVDDLNAHGFGTLGMQKPAEQNVFAAATWDKGVWRCIFRRAMNNGQTNDAQFRPGLHLPVALALWDGCARDRDGQKSITIWHDLEVQW